MAIRVGYACLALAVPGTQMRSCRLRTLTQEKVSVITAENLSALERLIQYNIKSEIKVFRISSDLVPFGSSPANTFPWHIVFSETFHRLGALIADNDLRVSMHPGQYTVLNSPDRDVVDRAILDLEYHNAILDRLETDAKSKIVLHLGGIYGDKTAAQNRFVDNFKRLSPAVQRRLVLENDERSYNIAEVLEVAQRIGVPAVFDNLHHALNPPAQKLRNSAWVDRCASTWKHSDGRQKVHYSQQSANGKPGAHSRTIAIDTFIEDMAPLAGRSLDVMLEVKDKNLSAIKCMLCLTEDPGIDALELEWSRYKYAVLEHSQVHYQQIRSLLKDKTAYPAVAFYNLVQSALERPVDSGGAANAAMHVWGYFKKTASAKSKDEFERILKGYMAGRVPLERLKRLLYKHADACHEDYLLQSYYFI
ncbi:UV DNA damage repair endonuclease UvsE [Bacillota bacterium Meth-B3]